MVDEARLLRSMLDAYARDGQSVVAVKEVSPEEISFYGCVEPDGVEVDGVVKIRRIVEKPPRDEAPSNLAVIGRYVFTPEIFDALDGIAPGAGARSSSPMRSHSCSKSNPCWHSGAKVAGTTSGTRWISCAPTSSSRSTVPTSARSSPRCCVSSFTGGASCERLIV